MTRLRPITLGTALVLACAAAAGAQTTPGVRTLVSFTGEQFEDDPHLSPNGKFILQARSNELRVYELATRQSWKLVEARVWETAWSPSGDMVTWVEAGDGGVDEYVWAIAVDASTGKARGAPQRVTMGQGHEPAFSLDGRWIAFNAPDSTGPTDVESRQPRHLSVVPATGGPERVVAHFESHFAEMFWSADGKSIYTWVAGARTSDSHAHAVVKVRVDGGKPEVVRSANEWLAGMTANRRYLVMVPATSPITRGDMATIIDTAGTEVGRVPLPIGTINENGVTGDSALVWIDVKDRKSLEIRPLAGGTPRPLPLIGESNTAPAWSPDGHQIAFHVRQGNRTSLAVMNADGTNVRVYPGAEVFDRHSNVSWSPDGKRLAFVGGSRHDLYVFDLDATSSRRIVVGSSATIGAFQWRPDGRSLIFAANTGPASGSIDQVTLTGERRKLLDISTLPRRQGGFTMIGGTQVFLRSDSGAYLTQVDSKATRRLAAVPPGTRAYVAALSHDRKWVAAPLLDDGQHHQIELISIESGTRRVIDVPFTPVPGGYVPAFLPGDSSLPVAGLPTADAVDVKLYSVPLDGSRPTVVASIGKESSSFALSVSPDGKNVIHTVQGEVTTSVLLVDLRPALAAAASRGSRR